MILDGKGKERDLSNNGKEKSLENGQERRHGMEKIGEVTNCETKGRPKIAKGCRPDQFCQ
jgi:hypothetical protein